MPIQLWYRWRLRPHCSPNYSTSVLRRVRNECEEEEAREDTQHEPISSLSRGCWSGERFEITFIMAYFAPAREASPETEPPQSLSIMTRNPRPNKPPEVGCGDFGSRRSSKLLRGVFTELNVQ